MRLFRFVPIICILLIFLTSVSMILSRGAADDVCLSVSDTSGVNHFYYVDTVHSRSHELPPTTTSNFAAASADGRYATEFTLWPDQTMDLVLSEFPGDDTPRITTVIRSGLRAETPLDSRNHVLWSPDDRSFAYLWRDLTNQLYLSVFHVPTTNE